MSPPSPQAISPEFDAHHFRHALSQFATGVTIITTRLESGSFFGLTASSFNSVSLDPPLVLWSLAQGASSMPLFTGNSHYVINVLSAEQTELAERFARRIDKKPVANAVDAGVMAQMQRIENTVDSMAIEIERISEAQRYMARLQSGK